MVWFNNTSLKTADPNEGIFIIALEKGLSLGTFNEALTKCKENSMNEIQMKVEKHIEVEEIALENGSRETWNIDQANKDQKGVLTRWGVPRSY